MTSSLITALNEALEPLLKTPFKPTPLVVNGQKIPYMRLETPIEIDDLFSFLDAQTLFPKVYWENQEDGTFVGIGSALQLDSFPQFGSKEGPLFFGGSDFMKRRRKTWKDFPEAAYFLPLIMIEKREGKTYLCLNRVQENLNIRLIEKTRLPTLRKPINRLNFPSFDSWKQEVNGALQCIQREDYLKVVLARLTQLEFKEPLSPYAILNSLKGNNRFAFQFSSEMAFVGLSPETLYRRRNGKIESAAVAGTRPRGDSEEEDKRLMRELLGSSKEQREFQMVKNAIYETLFPFCETLEIRKEQVLKTETVQHLHHTFQGRLKSGIDDATLIHALHPTPAVGGLPKTETLLELAEREPFDRGWYAAPIGWVSPSGAHHLVGIRSALIEKNTLSLFAGTGIVSGSIPEKEWEELESKIKAYQDFL